MNAAVPSLPVASHGLYLDKKEQLVSIIISPKDTVCVKILCLVSALQS